MKAVLLGSVSGERMDGVFTAKAEATGKSVSDACEEEGANVAMRMMVSAQNVANMIAFLASDAGQAVSGQSVGVCGNHETLR